MKSLLTTFLLGISIILPVANFQDESLILGTWVEKDPSFKRIFKSDGKCYEYYDDQLQDIYHYAIKKSGLLCSIQISEKSNISYLILTNISDANDNYCYEILSLNDEYLQLRYLERSSYFLFKKQK